MAKSELSGIDSVDPPPRGVTPEQAADHYLSGYEEQFKKARRIVKRRASGVTISASILTGVVAVLGSMSAVTADSWLDGSLAILTTAVSAAISVLLAWNDHFRHRELWIQRSGVLAEVNELRRRYAVRMSLPRYRRRSSAVEAQAVIDELGELLRRDLDDWIRIRSH